MHSISRYVDVVRRSWTTLLLLVAILVSVAILTWAILAPGTVRSATAPLDAGFATSDAGPFAVGSLADVRAGRRGVRTLPFEMEGDGP